jgi:tetratricopeptide (TPR) repeat protein
VRHVIETIKGYCQEQKLDPKRTYIWICCLCLNQHRVVESNKSGMGSASSVDFETEFKRRVLGIGRVLCMMTPWGSPANLKRVWCIYEIFMAMNEHCDLSIVMPPREKDRMSIQLFSSFGSAGVRGIDTLCKALAQVNIEQAEASVKQDKERILDLIRKHTGFQKVNGLVREGLRAWVGRAIISLVEERCSHGETTSESFTVFCREAGDILDMFGDYCSANQVRMKASKALQSIQHLESAHALTEKGQAYLSQNDYHGAREMFAKALEVNQKALGRDHLETAKLYFRIGQLLNKMGGEKGKALTMMRNCAAIQEMALGDHRDTGVTYCHIGSLLGDMGETNDGIEMAQKALVILESYVGKEHPDTALCYGTLAGLLKERDPKEALSMIDECCSIQESIKGGKHPDLASTFITRGEILRIMGRYGDSEISFRRGLAIYETTIGVESISAAWAYANLSAMSFLRTNSIGKDLDCKAMSILENLNLPLAVMKPIVIAIYNLYVSVGWELFKQGKYGAALELFQSGTVEVEKRIGAGHDDLVNGYHSVWLAVLFQGKLEKSQRAYKDFTAICTNLSIEDDLLVARTAHLANKIDSELELLQSALQEINLFPYLTLQEEPESAAGYIRKAEHASRAGNFDEAERCVKVSVALFEAAASSEHIVLAQNYAAACCQRGEIFRRMAKFESTCLFRQARLIYEALPDDNYVALAQTLAHLSVDMYLRGNRTEGASLHSQAISALKKSAMPIQQSSVALYKFYVTIGLELSEQGFYDSATLVLQHAVSVIKRQLGKEHSELASLYDATGLTFYSKGDLQGALREYKKSAMIRKANDGEEDPAFLETSNLLEWITEQQLENQKGGALSNLHQVISLSEPLLGTKHPDLASTLCRRAELLCRLGKLPEARENFEKALYIYDSFPEEDHTLIGWVCVNLSTIALLLNDPKEMEFHSDAILALKKSPFGADRYIVSLTNLYDKRVGCRKERESDPSDKAYEQSFLDEAGDDSSLAIDCYHCTVGLVLYAKGAHEGALQKYEKAAAAFMIRSKAISSDATAGGHDLRVASAFYHLGQIQLSMGDLEEASKSFQQALTLLSSSSSSISTPPAAADPKFLAAACHFMAIARVYACLGAIAYWHANGGNFEQQEALLALEEIPDEDTKKQFLTTYNHVFRHWTDDNDNSEKPSRSSLLLLPVSVSSSCITAALEEATGTVTETAASEEASDTVARIASEGQQLETNTPKSEVQPESKLP